MGWEQMARLGGGLRIAVAVFATAVMAASASAQTEASSQSDRRPGLTGSVPPVVRPDGRVEYRIATAESRVSVDARLDEPAWANAVNIPLRYEVSPADNGDAPVLTECLLTHDEQNLYFGCTARDPDPDGIRSYIVDRDGIDGHDRIVLTLDPFNDQRRAFQFGISALGVQSDAVLAQQGSGNPNQDPSAVPMDPSWDAIWASAGAITPDGYVVEAAIPFRSLRFPDSGDGAPWGVYVSRWWPRSSNVELRSSAWDRDNSCMLCQASLVSGIRGGAPGANLQVTPTLTASRADTRVDFPTGPITSGPQNRDVGLDAQWGVTSDLTLNLTANPDFSQVEADVAQLDVNSRFALFFPEKRPFFLEGADFFGTPLQAVFTRSIADPRAGGKLTGKLGNNAVGFLVAQDRANNLLIPGSEFSRATSLSEEVTTAVARFRRDIGGSSTVGALYTGREGAGYHNRVGGFDAFYRPTGSITIQGQVLRSSTEYPSEVARSFDQKEGAFAGTAAQLVGAWVTRDWSLRTNVRQLDPDFRADAGFITQSGLRDGNVNLTRTWRGGSGRWFSQINATAGTWRMEDYERNPLNRGMWVGVQYRGPGQTFLGVWPNFFIKNHFAGKTYTGMKEVYFNAEAAPSGRVAIGLMGNVGETIDFANQRLGSQLRLSPSATLRLGRNVEATLQHTYQRMDNEGARVFTANLSQLRAVYNFSPRSFVRGIVQFTQTDREQDQYTSSVDARSRSVFSQLLYAYKLNPQTVLFLGYSENGDGLTDENQVNIPITTRGRTFFFKLGYAWRP